MHSGAGAGPVLHEYEPEIGHVYRQYSDAVESLPGLLQRIINGVASWVLADPHGQLSPLRVVSEVCSPLFCLISLFVVYILYPLLLDVHLYLDSICTISNAQ